MVLPNFLVIGAMKAGTTTIFKYLNQHPQVYMSLIKEPRFFSSDIKFDTAITNYDDYLSLFKDVSTEVAIGEASVDYLRSSVAAKRIRKDIPDVKLIAILRDPVDRAYSHVLMNWCRDFIGCNQEEIIQHFLQIVYSKDNLVIPTGFYFTQLQRFFEFFDQNQLKVLLFEDLQLSPDRVMHDIFRFIDVDDNFSIDRSIERYNVGGIVKNKSLYNLIVSLRSLKKSFPWLIDGYPYKTLNQLYHKHFRNENLAKPPQLPLNVRKQLISIYSQDILQLQELIHRDLSGWLE
jgi:hypothetical protein